MSFARHLDSPFGFPVSVAGKAWNLSHLRTVQARRSDVKGFAEATFDSLEDFLDRKGGRDAWEPDSSRFPPGGGSEHGVSRLFR